MGKREHVVINMASQGIIVNTCMYVIIEGMNTYRLVVKKVVTNNESLVRRRDGK